MMLLALAFSSLQSCKDKTAHYVVTVTQVEDTTLAPSDGLALYQATLYPDNTPTKVWVPALVRKSVNPPYIANVDRDVSQEFGTVSSVPPKNLRH